VKKLKYLLFVLALLAHPALAQNKISLETQVKGTLPVANGGTGTTTATGTAGSVVLSVAPTITGAFKADRIILNGANDTGILVNTSGNVSVARGTAVGGGADVLSAGTLFRSGAAQITNTIASPAGGEWFGVFGVNSFNSATLIASNPMTYSEAATIYVGGSPLAAADVGTYSGSDKYNLSVSRDANGRQKLWAMRVANGRVGLFASTGVPGDPRNQGGLEISPSNSIPFWGTKGSILSISGVRQQDYGQWSGSAVIPYSGGELVSTAMTTTSINGPQIDANCAAPCTGGVTYADVSTVRIDGPPTAYADTPATFTGSVASFVLTVTGLTGTLLPGQGQIITGAGLPANTTLSAVTYPWDGTIGIYQLTNPTLTPVTLSGVAMTATLSCNCVSITSPWSFKVASGNASFGGRLEIATSRSVPTFGSTGANIRVNPFTITDTSSTGTVNNAMGSSFGVTTLAATNPITVSDAAPLIVAGNSVAGTNVTLTRSWGFYNLGDQYIAQALAVGTKAKGSAGTVNAASGYLTNGVSGYTGTKTAGACTLTISGGIITNVTGC